MSFASRPIVFAPKRTHRRSREVVAVVKLKIVLVLLLMAAVVTGRADEPSPQTGDSAGAASAESWRNFENLVNTINGAQQELAALRKQLQQTHDDAERERLRAEVNRVSDDIDSLEAAWEMWATGGVDMQMFTPKPEEKFDWRAELQSVFEPIVVELRRLTERPRKIERLRSEQLFFQQRVAAAEAAVRNLTEYKAKAPSPELQDAFAGLESRWRKRRDDLQNRLALVNFELQELLSPDKPTEQRARPQSASRSGRRRVGVWPAVAGQSFVYAIRGARGTAATVHRARRPSRVHRDCGPFVLVRRHVGAVRARRLYFARPAADHGGRRRRHPATFAARLSQGGEAAAQYRASARGRARAVSRPAVEGTGAQCAFGAGQSVAARRPLAAAVERAQQPCLAAAGPGGGMVPDARG